MQHESLGDVGKIVEEDPRTVVRGVCMRAETGIGYIVVMTVAGVGEVRAYGSTQQEAIYKALQMAHYETGRKSING